MRILQFGKFYPPATGGIEQVMHELTEGLNKKGVKCDVLCSNKSNKYQENEINGYKVYRTASLGKIFATSITPQMAIKLKAMQDYYDIIHAHLPDPMANLALFLTKPKTKIILHWHSDIVRQRFLLRFYEPLLKWLIKRADLVIGPTNVHIMESDYALYLKDKSKIIPHPFDIEKFKSIPIDKEFFDALKNTYKTNKIVLSVGRLVYYKGFDYLIEAARYLPKNYKILIVGEGKLRQSLEKKAISLNVKGKVIFIGRVSQEKLAACYKICDLFCLSSVFRSEMFGMVQLEAMAFGKPIVSTKIKRSAVCNVNINGETGLCVEPKNPEAIAEAIKYILENPEEYKRMSDNALRMVESYSSDVIINEFVKAYKKLLEGV